MKDQRPSGLTVSNYHAQTDHNQLFFYGKKEKRKRDLFSQFCSTVEANYPTILIFETSTMTSCVKIQKKITCLEYNSSSHN